VIDHFTGLKDTDAEQSVDSHIGGFPLTPQCIIPDTMVINFLKNHLGRDGEVTKKLCRLTLARLNAIPAECFGPGQRDAALAAIDKREANRSRIKALLDSLETDLRREAERVVGWCGGEFECHLSNEEIIHRARST
jgi:hypothetical protein